MSKDLISLESVWRNTELRRLVEGRLLATFAEWMWYTVAAVYAFTLAGVGAVGAIGLASVLPAAVLSPGLGYVIDRYPRERVLASTIGLRFFALALTAVSAAFFPSVSVLVGVAVVEGIATLFVRPTTGALLPSVTQRPKDFVRAHAALGVADNVGVVAGPIAGGLLLAGTTPTVAFVTAAAVTLGSLAAIIRVRVNTADLVRASLAAGLRQALADAVSGARTVAQPDVRSISLVIVLAFAMMGASEVFVVPLAIDALRWGKAGPGLLVACIAGGGLLADLMLGAIGRRRLGPWFVFSGVIMGIALTFVAAAPITGVVLPASFAFGASAALVITAGQVQVQTLIPSSSGGRVLGTIEGLGFFAMAAGVWATTRLTEGWSLRISLFALGSVTLLGTTGLVWALLGADRRVAARRQRVGVLDRIALFEPLTNFLREQIATQIEIVDVAPGDVVISQGESGDSFYVVETGTLDVLVDGRQIRPLGPSDFFGEIALLHDTARTATVRAATDCRLWVLSRGAFLSLLTGCAPVRHAIRSVSDQRQHGMPATPRDPDAGRGDSAHRR